MYKRLVSLLLCLLLCTAGVSASTENYIANSDFEATELLWEGGQLATESPYAGNGCLAFSNPADSMGDSVLHTVTYTQILQFEENGVYELECYVRNNFAQAETPVACAVSIEDETLHLQITQSSATWQRVCARFTVSSDALYVLCFSAYAPTADAMFFVDSVRLQKMSFAPVSMGIEGPHDVYIPDIGYETYSYTPVAIDRKGNTVSMLPKRIYVADALPDGISFDETSCRLRVDSTATESHFQLRCDALPGATEMTAATLTVQAGKNYVENGSFEDLPQYVGWNTEETSLTIADGYAAVPTTQKGDNLYGGTLLSDNTMVLLPDRMYVFRARVRSESGYETRKIVTAAQSDENSVIHVAVSQIGGGQWSDAIAAFTVPHESIYTLQIDLFATDGRPLYVDNIAIRAEQSAPTDIVFDAPAYISLPQDGTVSVPVDFVVRDQSGTVLPTEEAVLSVSPQNAGVTVSGKTVTVTPAAKHTDFTLIATALHDDNVRGIHPLVVGDASVGDGSFETTAPGQWWATAAPSQLNIVSIYSGHYPTNGTQMARLTMNGAVSILLSDSMYRYDNDKSYVFEADMAATVPDIETVVTVLVDNAASTSFDDNLVVGQFALSAETKHITKLFSPSMPITGRLMIAFTTAETHDQQVILIDTVSVSRAAVATSNVFISGYPYVNKNIIGNYKFSSNFAGTDASSYRWLSAQTIDGVYMPIVGQTGATLSITEDMDGQYIKFEVTPISLSGPVTGASVTSTAVKIGEALPVSSPQFSEEDPVTERPPEVVPTQPPESATEQPPEVQTPPRGELAVINLQSTQAAFVPYYADMLSHWAREDVVLMSAAGIAQGRGNALFAPQEHITRAEFSAFLIRAFGLAPTYYENTFSDVRYYAWYAGVVSTVMKYGIAQGTGDNTFSPETSVTREQMAVMLMRAYKKTGAPLSDTTYAFTDLGNISAWAVREVGEAYALGILSGMPDGSFEPKRPATRAEAITALKRMMDAAA